MSGLADPAPITTQLVFGLPGWADGNAGVTTEALGGLAAHDWLHGVVPWWNPYGGVGLPLAAEAQDQAFFLPFVLLLALPHGVVLLKAALQVVAGLATAPLLRRLGIDRATALAGGVLAELGGTFTWHAHGPAMPIAFLPLLLLGLERAREAAIAGRSGGIATIGASLAFSLAAGFPETAFLDTLFAAVYGTARLAAAPRAARPRFVAATAIGLGAGLLLAAPATVPFLEFIDGGYAGPHADESADRLAPGVGGLLLLPFMKGQVYFSFLATGDHAGEVEWWSAGGYVTPALLLAALLAFSGRGRPHGGLRKTLGFFVLVSLGRALGLPVVTALVDLVPMVRRALFSFYILPSLEFAAILLAGLAVSDWRAGRLSRAAPLRVAACVAALAAALLLANRGEIARLLAARPLPFLLAAAPATLVSLTVLALAAASLRRPSTPRRHHRLLALLVLDAAVSFATPLLSAVPPPRLDDGPVRFLRAHLGLGRVDCLTLFAPNYPALFRVASVNATYLPAPANWVRFLRARFGPGFEPAGFFGEHLRPTTAVTDWLAEGVRPFISVTDAVAVLESLGVSHILAPAGEDPFADSLGTDVAGGVVTPRPLATGDALAATLAWPAAEPPGTVGAVAVQLATYRARADGRLAVALCVAARCRTGTADLARAVDNGVLVVRLDRPLVVAPGETATVRLVRTAGTRPLAVWLWRARTAPATLLPYVQLRFDPAIAARAPVVYADGFATLRALPAPAPYFAAPACRLAPLSRTRVTLDCPRAATLLRRELAYPGWRARIDRRPAVAPAADGLFQRVAVPAGRHQVRFSYAPPGAGLCWGASLAGLLLLLVAAAAAHRRG